MKMATTGCVRKGPNNLLLGLIIVSLIIHGFILLHISGLYRSSFIEYIEVAVTNKKPSRGLPRPPVLPKEQKKQTSKTKIVRSAPIQLPDVNQIIVGNGDVALSAGLVEGVSGGIKGDSYMDMIQRKIERKKKYPKGPDGTYREAIVTVTFVINPDGSVSNVRITKGCPYDELNHAARQAVLDSAPFPKPPPKLFKGGLEIPLNLSFELI